MTSTVAQRISVRFGWGLVWLSWRLQTNECSGLNEVLCEGGGMVDTTRLRFTLWFWKWRINDLANSVCAYKTIFWCQVLYKNVLSMSYFHLREIVFGKFPNLKITFWVPTPPRPPYSSEAYHNALRTTSCSDSRRNLRTWDIKRMYLTRFRSRVILPNTLSMFHFHFWEIDFWDFFNSPKIVLTPTRPGNVSKWSPFWRCFRTSTRLGYHWPLSEWGLHVGCSFSKVFKSWAKPLKPVIE